MSSNDPEQIRADIEATRARLSADVDTLAEEANPKTIARRKVDDVKDSVRDRAAGLKDKLMGSADDAKGSAQDALGSAQDALGSARSSAGNAPGAVKSKTRGNPLAAGVIAFGAGMLVSALIPSSDREQQAVSALKERAEPVKQQLTDVAKEAADNLKQPAQEAVASVKDTATDAAQNVKAEGQSAGQDVKDQAAASKDAVQETRS